MPLEKYTNSSEISELMNDAFCFHKQLSLYNGNRTESVESNIKLFH